MSKPGNWPTGLCDCFSDCGTCCYGFWCGPCLYGDNAEKLGGSCFASCFLYWLCGYMFSCCFTGNRQKLRANHNLAADPCSDCCVMCCCPACAVCQEARVIKSHGAVPSAQFMQVQTPQFYAPPAQTMAVA